MIQIFKDTQQLSQAAADLFVQAANEAVQEKGRFTVALTGGSSPIQMHQFLAQSPYREQVPWEQTYIFWGDERWVPLTDEQSNAKMALETLLNHVPIPKNQIFPMWGKQEPEIFAQQYEETLRQHLGQTEPSFDLILLGMGDDGHTASLFPGTAVLQEKEKWVVAYYLEPKQIYRITLTAPLINQAKKVVFITYGEKKADALYEVLEGRRNPEQYPSQLIQPQNEAIWLVDEAAYRRLSQAK
ncbi:6-phosphogluconolactonase [Adhaeribacter rhizoryzae]|uniref:6-phosphogluconolactonase n=1 Tax=Adhaeribacter rhizoryzae TaxID=2607907 RepID=A0A5M6DB31_9BACT|nr:6-phosphogluconolactonase [Adhaeribacter rhizoryzae]KAA5542345.1 6-phosphogluconolactonase [Adhaeribacter rhizoryzae]